MNHSQRVPTPGELVEVRQRNYLVEEVIEDSSKYNHIVRLACVDDDAQGQKTEVFWEHEYDRRVREQEDWGKVAEKGFDSPEMFAAFFHSLRWNCVTATDPKLFQAPFRAGISIDEFQLEPLRRAIAMPRVNLFIADDVGLGKTIEAGLILRELLLRKKVDFVVVAAPPSMLLQWQSELEIRFGLTFQIIDRDYVLSVRRERGFATNPWQTHSRFLISHRLLSDEKYMADLRLVLSPFKTKSLLILDEAHHAAPSSGTKYAIDTDITRYVTEFSKYFEHRLFLSATPHNGHSNSFSTLLSILDPHRFTKGAKVDPANVKATIVRRLKEDLREIKGGGFPKRVPVKIEIDGLLESAPELTLAGLLSEYDEVRRKRFEKISKRDQAAAGLVLTTLQHRLLSSIEAFYVTFRKHRSAVLTQLKAADQKKSKTQLEVEYQVDLLEAPLGSEDEKATLTEDLLQAETEQQIETATRAAEELSAEKPSIREIELLNEMEEIASQARFELDGKIQNLLEWISKEMCPHVLNQNGSKSWADKKIIIFTEWDDTKRYIKECIEKAITDTELANERIAIYHGPTSIKKREKIKEEFNKNPADSPLRILICTDAAREGLNLQSHCYNLFHFDIPWNPSRMEQRNGRIDRKLQPSDKVYCHYFIYRQRPEDRVLKTIAEKAETIIKELGSMSPIVETKIVKALSGGIVRSGIDDTISNINNADLESKQKQAIKDELEAARARQDELRTEIKELEKLRHRSEEWLSFKESDFKSAISAGLVLAGSTPLKEIKYNGRKAYEFPRIDLEQSQTWADTLDTLRTPNNDELKTPEWRKNAPIRPLIFEDVGALDDSLVHLHLEHRVTQRLLGRFLSQGFTHHDLSRACLGFTEDNTPRVVLLGKISLFGPRADRLHEEIISIAAEWLPLSKRKERLKPYGKAGEQTTLDLLNSALSEAGKRKINKSAYADLNLSIAKDTNDLLGALEERALDAIEDARKKLELRGKKESDELRRIIAGQINIVEKEISSANKDTGPQMLFDFVEEQEQFKRNRKLWEKRLEELKAELDFEPKRVEERYEIRAQRVEPVGIVYLWPMSGGAK